MPGPRFARNLPTGVSGALGDISSMSDSPNGSEKDGCSVDLFRRMRLDPEDITVERNRRLEITDRYSDVSNTCVVEHRFLQVLRGLQHHRRITRWARRIPLQYM